MRFALSHDTKRATMRTVFRQRDRRDHPSVGEIDMPTSPSSRHSLSCGLGHAGLAILGFVLTVFGIALCATLWLMPIGLPLALLGVAFMGAAGESH